jgi:DNA-binding GntR family transcriptional regulator
MEDTLAQKAYQELRARLRAGKLPPGTRLVNRTLAADLGISFTPVREAISRLSSEGLVEHIPGSGAFVRRLDRQDLAQLYDLRATLEPYAAAEAARHISAVELEELRSVCGEFENIAKQLRGRKSKVASPRVREAWLRAEERFHELLIEAARNPWLTKMAVELWLVFMVFASQAVAPDLLTPDVAKRTWIEHSRLLELLQERDADAAHDWMKAHIQHGRTHVLSSLSKSLS